MPMLSGRSYKVDVSLRELVLLGVADVRFLLRDLVHRR